jgi:hypothetical protein
MLIIYNSPKQSTINKPQTDEDKLVRVLNASNIIIVNKNFTNNIENTIVFDNFDKINKNFNLFMSIYFPSIDMNKIYELLKDYNINNIQKIINDKNINVLQYFFSDINLFYIASSIYTENNNINIISFGLFIILMWNLLMKNISNDNITYKTNINDWQFYYLNDYNKVNDFYIYIVPKTITENINTLNTNTNVIETNNISIMKLPNIYKISLHQIIKETILKPYISFIRDTSIINITDNEYNDFIPLIKKNSISLYELNIYQFALLVLTAYKNGNIDNNTQLVIDMINFMNNPLNLTQSYRTFMKFKNPNNRLIKSNNFMKLTDNIKEEMITNMVNKLKMQYNKL